MLLGRALLAAGDAPAALAAFAAEPCPADETLLADASFRRLAAAAQGLACHGPRALARGHACPAH